MLTHGHTVSPGDTLKNVLPYLLIALASSLHHLFIYSSIPIIDPSHLAGSQASQLGAISGSVGLGLMFARNVVFFTWLQLEVFDLSKWRLLACTSFFKPIFRF